MNDFSQEITNFQKNGIYIYKFDEGGNLIFNQTSQDFNQHYVSIPLTNYKYDNSKIGAFYDLEFKEFSPTVEEEVILDIPATLKDMNSTLLNTSLLDKLDELMKQSDNKPSDAQNIASKQIIIDLRIKLGQGLSNRDFADTFPYLPITKNTR